MSNPLEKKLDSEPSLQPVNFKTFDSSAFLTQNSFKVLKMNRAREIPWGRALLEP